MNQSKPRGVLSYSVGETRLSEWEAAHLRPGDVVLTSRMAGYPGFLLFNQWPVGLGEVVVLDQSFGVRVVDSEFRPRFDVEPGRYEELGDGLPGQIELGRLEADLDAVAGLGSHSFVNLGTPWDGEDDATLVWAGLPLVRGKVVVVGEAMGLRVTGRLLDLPVPTEVRQTGNLADAQDSARAKAYDFSRPDRWSLDQIRRMNEIHGLFQRTLEASLSEASALLGGRTDRIVVDQCTLAEAREWFAREGLAGAWVFEQGGAVRSRLAHTPRTPFLEDPKGPRPVPAADREVLASLATVRSSLRRRPVYAYAGPGWSDPEALRSGLPRWLREGWKRSVDFGLEPVVDDLEALSLPGHEMVLVILIRGADDPIRLGLVYPYVTLEPYMNVLGS